MSNDTGSIPRDLIPKIIKLLEPHIVVRLCTCSQELLKVLEKKSWKKIATIRLIQYEYPQVPFGREIKVQIRTFTQSDFYSYCQYGGIRRFDDKAHTIDTKPIIVNIQIWFIACELRREYIEILPKIDGYSVRY
jgi:hypothetical protein